MDTPLEGQPYVAIETDLLLELLELAKTLGQRWLSIRFDHENRHVVFELLPPDRVATKIMGSGLSEESAKKLVREYMARAFELYEVVWFDREWHEKLRRRNHKTETGPHRRSERHAEETP